MTQPIRPKEPAAEAVAAGPEAVVEPMTAMDGADAAPAAEPSRPATEEVVEAEEPAMDARPVAALVPAPAAEDETDASVAPFAEPLVATEAELPTEAEVAVAAEVATDTKVTVAAEVAAEAEVAELVVAEVPETPGTPEAIAAAPVAPAAVADTTALVPLEEIAPAIAAASLSRRAFLGFGLAIAGGLTGAAGLARLFPVFSDTSDTASPIVPAYDPAGKAWTFVVDTSACIGCGLCVVACKEENHVPEEAAYTRTWVERHVATSDGERFVDSPDAGMYGFPAQSTAPGAAGKTVVASHFEPRLCMQCEDSPCTAVCPVGATYRTEDGVILVDSRRCIGCGYCVVACPYGARYIVPAGESAPNDTPGVADKCTWCYHRISRGAKPACVEVCPVGARRFGDANDPSDEIAAFVREHHPQPLHPEFGTRPRVLYLGPSIEEA